MTEGGFTAKLQNFAIRAPNKLMEVKRNFCIALFIAVIMDTPVDTGRLRGNWQCSVASPLLDKLPVRPDSAAIAEVLRAVNSLKEDEFIFLRNNLEYVIPIEYDGHSHVKAPEGMVRKNIARVTHLINEAIARSVV